jgi:hypothetical protein
MLTLRFAMRPLRLQKVWLNFAFLCELVLFDKLGEAGHWFLSLNNLECAQSSQMGSRQPSQTT